MFVVLSESVIASRAPPSMTAVGLSPTTSAQAYAAVRHTFRDLLKSSKHCVVVRGSGLPARGEAPSTHGTLPESISRALGRFAGSLYV